MLNKEERLFRLVRYIQHDKTTKFMDEVEENRDLIRYSIHGIDLLNIAILQQNLDVLEYLLKNGAVPDEGIHTAVLSANIEIIDKLLKYGANINHRIKRGSMQVTPLYNCFDETKRKERAKVFFYLLKKGAEIELNEIEEILCQASAEGQNEIISYLLEYFNLGYPTVGKDAEINTSYRSPLYLAVSSYRKDTIRLLMEKGAASKANYFDIRNSLIEAIKKGYWDIADVLARILLQLSPHLDAAPDLAYKMSSVINGFRDRYGESDDIVDKVIENYKLFPVSVQNAINLNKELDQAIIAKLFDKSSDSSTSASAAIAIKRFMKNKELNYRKKIDEEILTKLRNTKNQGRAALNQILKSIDMLLIENNIKPILIFNKPLSGDRILDMLNGSLECRNLNLNDLVVLYGWHDGMRLNQLDDEYSGLIFSSLTDIVAYNRKLRRVKPKFYFALGHGIYGSTLYIDLRKDPPGGCVHLVNVDYKDETIIFGSLSNYFSAIRDCFLAGVIKPIIKDGNRYLAWAPHVIESIYRKHALESHISDTFDISKEYEYEPIFRLRNIQE